MKSFLFVFLLYPALAFSFQDMVCDGTLDINQSPPVCTGTWIVEDTQGNVLDMDTVQELAEAALGVFALAFAFRFVSRVILR